VPTIREALLHGWNLYQAGELHKAEQVYRQILQAAPQHAEVWLCLGLAYQGLARFADAEASYRRALGLRPAYPEGWNNLGNVLQPLGKAEEAAACYQQALQLKPDFVVAYNNLANLLANLNRVAEAEAAYREALRLQPGLPEVHNNLGNLLQRLGRGEEAEAAYREAVRLRPELPDTYNNLGNLLVDLGRLEEAEAAYQEALRLRPSFPEAHNGLANVSQMLGKDAQAEAGYREALRLNPSFAAAHMMLGMRRLRAGAFEEGWREHAWRWQCGYGPQRGFAQPMWNGEALDGRTILLHAEQGLGDTINFVRYADLVKRHTGPTGRVVLECQEALATLLASCPGVDQVVPRGAALPAFDWHAPLLNLPGIFHTDLGSIPANVPYLFADPGRTAVWRQELAGAGLKVGIAWQGSPKHITDRQRSVPLTAFAPLAALAGVRLYSLQKDAGTEQLRSVPFPIADLGPRLADFSDTAAVVSALELVVSVDSALAHLAGALGAPVWMATPFAPDWRWLEEREDSPWYPSLRLFRQTRRGDWADVFGRIAQALSQKTITSAKPEGESASPRG
jgi:tetratricopeptide (TPR) repeat protein